MEEQAHIRTLQRFRLILRGAMTLYDDEGTDIRQILLEQKKHYLISGLNMIGTALYWLDEQIDHLLKEKP